MFSRRQLLQQTGAALGLVVVTSGCSTRQESLQYGARRMPTAVRIKSVIRREETVLRLGGCGDNWHMTWAADDRQYVSLCDGFGWPGMPGYEQVNSEFHSRLYAVYGNPPEATFEYLPGYPEIIHQFDPKTRHFRDKQGSYYNFGTIALDGHIYQFLSTLNHPDHHDDGSPWPGMQYVGAKLIYSPDNGRTWRNQDGSTPVTWAKGDERSRQNLVFYEESQQAFSLPSILQMGQNYELNQDGYVYVYAPNGNTEGTMNELVMFRVPKGRILDRRAYEFFAGLQSNGSASWRHDIEGRSVVHTFPSGWVNKSAHPFAWMPSIVYNAPLGLYMMTSWGTASSADGVWFDGPSYLGFWTSETPWGPWTQIGEEAAWLPGNDAKALAYAPQIAPKWIAKDGMSFWLVWTDFQPGQGPASEDFTAVSKRSLAPFYAFNTQRVDLIID